MLKGGGEKKKELTVKRRRQRGQRSFAESESGQRRKRLLVRGLSYGCCRLGDTGVTTRITSCSTTSQAHNGYYYVKRKLRIHGRRPQEVLPLKYWGCERGITEREERGIPSP